MTTWYRARQRQSDGRWDYTSSNTSNTWCHAEGYCRGWTEYTEDELRETDARLGEGFSERLIAERDRNLAYKERFHKNGHATQEEAVACYRDYVFDCERREYVSDDTQKPCMECQAWTPNVIEIGRPFGIWLHLCDEHKTAVLMRKHYDDHHEKRRQRVA